MTDGIKFNKDGTIDRCGREIDPPSWILPTSLMSEARIPADGPYLGKEPCMCPECAAEQERQPSVIRGTIRVSIPLLVTPPKLSFVRDLSTSMIEVGRGYDPYNHVGHDTVCKMLGVMR